MHPGTREIIEHASPNERKTTKSYSKHCKLTEPYYSLWFGNIQPPLVDTLAIKKRMAIPTHQIVWTVSGFLHNQVQLSGSRGGPANHDFNSSLDSALFVGPLESPWSSKNVQGNDMNNNKTSTTIHKMIQKYKVWQTNVAAESRNTNRI